MNLKQRKLLQCLIMTSCDLSDQTKKWENAKGVAVRYFTFFYRLSGTNLGKQCRPKSRSSLPRVYTFYAPNFEKVGSILLSACPFLCSFVRPLKKSLKLGF